MITAETASCTQVVRPENFASQFGNLVTTFSCEVPDAQGQWADFLSNPQMVIGAVAAIGTLGAVGVALWQSRHAKRVSESAKIDAALAREDAIAIAERTDSLAMQRDLRIKELERFEVLPEVMFRLVDSITGTTAKFTSATADLIFAVQKYFVYIRQTNSDVAEKFSDIIDLVMQTASIINEYLNPTLNQNGSYTSQHTELDEWFAANTDVRDKLQNQVSLSARGLVKYYDSSWSTTKTVAYFEAIAAEMKVYFAPHLVISENRRNDL